MQVSDVVFYSSSVLLVLFTFLPFINTPAWYIRIFDYPRFQLFILILIAFLLSLGFISLDRIEKWVTLAALLASLIYLGWLVIPYTVFHKKMIERDSSSSPRYKIKLLASNVYQYNTDYDRVTRCVSDAQPDVILLVETDQQWKDAMQVLKKKFPYAIEVPQANTYGMLLYSRYPIEKQEVKYLIDPEIPSISVDLNVDGKTIRLYGIHPTPPVPQENPESTDRDAEILMVGRQSKKYNGPSIVLGDLNDVAWSHTTRLFLRISGMLDPRIGRGMYSTFHARVPFMRWPLDHFFVSSHFRLMDLRVEQGVGSDHFPISLTLSILEEDKEKELEPEDGDQEEARGIIREARED